VYYNTWWFGGTVFLTKYSAPMPVYHVYMSQYNATTNPNMLKYARIIVDRIMAKHDGVVVVANMGGTFSNRTELRTGLSVLLPYLNVIAKTTRKRNIVLWRETTAQHYDSHALGYQGDDLGMSINVIVYIYIYRLTL
jgi:hypothetical protein